uniref:Uncharacterized protein n=1 Tax=Brassica oleracea TaxID=3712 RepID=A0A3P6FEF6_BRAOL|nr:unnamed protein product [Brassica oleracea]
MAKISFVILVVALIAFLRVSEAQSSKDRDEKKKVKMTCMKQRT